MEIPRRQLDLARTVSLEFRGAVGITYINLGVIRVEVILKTLKLDEIIREWMGKRKVQELSLGRIKLRPVMLPLLKNKTNKQTSKKALL